MQHKDQLFLLGEKKRGRRPRQPAPRALGLGALEAMTLSAPGATGLSALEATGLSVPGATGLSASGATGLGASGATGVSALGALDLKPLDLCAQGASGGLCASKTD